MTVLSVLLLAATLGVRYLLAHKHRAGWWLDMAIVPAWTVFYVRAEAWPLLVLPLVFGLLDVQALRGAWRR